MDKIVLQTDWDIDVAVAKLVLGQAVKVEVGADSGPHGREPKVELLRLLLDAVKGKFKVTDTEYVPHPWVENRYLQSCVIKPKPSRVHPTEVREPRVSPPAPPSRSATVD